MAREERSYIPSATAYEFHKDNSFCRAVLGCVGSGKSVMMCMEIFRRACEQKQFNGVRTSKWGVIRSTYRQLETTTLVTFMRWLGAYGTVTMGSPIKFKSNMLLPDQTRLDLEVLFFPLSTPEDIQNLKSLELTSAWINEASQIKHNFIPDIKERLGRFPEKSLGGFDWNGLIIDTNPPDDDHWFYELFEEQRPPGHVIFKQPGALIRLEDGGYVPNPNAENIENHSKGYGYYFDMLYGAPESKIKVDILGEYGTSFSGKAVYPGFHDKKHMAKGAIMPVRGSPIIVGMDFGLNPAAVFCQMRSDGTITVFDECFVPDCGFDEFMDEHLLPTVRSKYTGMQIQVIGDPSAMNRSAMNRNTAYDILIANGLAAKRAYTNNPDSRIDAVKWALSRTPPMQVCPERCKYIRKGFMGGYHFKQRQGVFAARPDKGEYSHAHDALQYACLWFKRGDRPEPRDRPRGKVRILTPSDAATSRPKFGWV
jgi:Phage terminase large subunit